MQGSAASDSTAATDTATLISAIANANNWADINTICLADGTYTLTASNVIDYGDNGLPLITSDITLVGLGDNVVIERGTGAPAFRLLHVKDTGTFTLRDVTITGNFARRGGGVRMNGAALTVTGSTFQNNSADREGGAIYVSGINSPVDLSTSQFTANSATNSGGFYLSGTTTSLIANDVVFTGNQANGGGAIYAVPSTLDITNATFTSNEALVSSGGAIYTSIDSSDATATSTLWGTPRPQCVT